MARRRLLSPSVKPLYSAPQVGVWPHHRLSLTPEHAADAELGILAACKPAIRWLFNAQAFAFSSRLLNRCSRASCRCTGEPPVPPFNPQSGACARGHPPSSGWNLCLPTERSVLAKLMRSSSMIYANALGLHPLFPALTAEPLAWPAISSHQEPLLRLRHIFAHHISAHLAPSQHLASP